MFAWAGGAFFALSLTYFVFTYAVTFARPAGSGPVLPAVAWNTALFSAFALHHSVFARARVRRRVHSWMSQANERPFYVWVASLLFILVCAAWRPVPGLAWSLPGWPARWAMRALQLFGVYLTLRSAAFIGVLTLAGVREPRAGEFRAAGPYGWVRHPIYTGWFLLVFAVTPMTMTQFVFACVSSAYLLVAIPFEERSLRTASGGAYDEYMRKVPWKLVPGVY